MTGLSFSYDFKSDWQRFEHRGKAIYLSTRDANWFVPNAKGDGILQNLIKGSEITVDAETHIFLSGLPQSRQSAYAGRNTASHDLTLKELWFHITNRCNLRCTHCLFSSSPQDSGTLTQKQILSMAEEAYGNGCRLFALTGGEPFVHPEIDGIINALLSLPESHVAVLTNGMAVVPFIEQNEPDPAFFHVQISVDGLAENHDRIRSKGSFHSLSQNLMKLKSRAFPYTLSMCVTRDNVTDMPGLIDYAWESGCSNVHFMWYFIKGRGPQSMAPDTDEVFEYLIRAAEKAAEKNITIDNLESLKTQVFAPPGTIHDGSSAGFESLAVGPCGKLYPSAALVGTSELASDLSSGLLNVFRESPVLKAIRSASIVHQTGPFRFILGGGDMDHSYVHQRTFMGHDPYMKLHEQLALRLITNETKRVNASSDKPLVLLQMGDILESCGAKGDVAFVHSNCLLATSQPDSLTTVKNFYSEAVGDLKEDILNPVCYEPEILSHIPEAFRFRGYGCGSPVLDADINEGDHVADLGSGSGVECFIAAKLCGNKGKVTGVDMLDPMLGLAEKAKCFVEKNLGYSILTFKKGYLENLPIENSSVDTVISNCVMNLSVNKIKAYAEIFRVLTPGGKLVISDVVCETEPGPSIRNDDALKGECIAGALTEKRLLSILELTGFTAISLIKRFPYRNVNGHDFYSLTYKAEKPYPSAQVKAMYRGPLPYLKTEDGTILPRGVVMNIGEHLSKALGDQVFTIDNSGFVTNIMAENSCACYRAPEGKDPEIPIPNGLSPERVKHNENCMVCGSPLVYENIDTEKSCHYCNRILTTNALCKDGHFVCDACHAKDALDVIRHICVHTEETDMLRLFEQIRRHPSVPMHGPEYHAMIPGIILACYRNSGGNIENETILSGISRGSTVPGGFCGFMGICGAAVGVGAAFSLIVNANPVKSSERKTVQTVVQNVLKEIADLNAARCCQRDGTIALKKAADLSEEYLTVTLKAHYELKCRQRIKNKECPGNVCPLFEKSFTKSPFVIL